MGIKKRQKRYKNFKLGFDIVFSLLVILLGSPIFILISILIKFSSRGPIFYYHKRVGKNFKTFYCIKFRTMHPEADDILENLLDSNELIKNEYEKTHKIKNDPT